MKWLKRKQELKMRVINYFKSHGAKKQDLVKICSFMKSHASIEASIARQDFFPAITKHHWGYLEDQVKENFSPQHRSKVVEFLKKLAILEIEAEKYIDEQRSEPPEWSKFDPDFDWSGPDVEIIVGHDAIVVHCLKFVRGFSSQLPKGGNYQGKGSGKWVYPVSAFEKLKDLGEVLLYPGVTV